jgi:sugar-specific transcriptional regulator TrmB
MFDHMNEQNIITQLEQYGLNEIEAKMYVQLLQNGPQTALELSRGSNIDRSKVYRGTERLSQKGFIEQSHAAWGKKLRAASPANIALIVAEEETKIQTKKDGLAALINELNSVSTNVQQEFEVRHYRGQDGLRQMLWNQLTAKKDIVSFSYKNKNDIVGKTYADKIRAEQAERKITIYELENETDQGDYWYTDVEGWEKFYESRHISSKALDIKQYIAVFNHTVSIINWLDKEQVGLEIINGSYADMQRQLFWKFWDIAGNKPRT